MNFSENCFFFSFSKAENISENGSANKSRNGEKG